VGLAHTARNTVLCVPTYSERRSLTERSRHMCRRRVIIDYLGRDMKRRSISSGMLKKQHRCPQIFDECTSEAVLALEGTYAIRGISRRGVEITTYWISSRQGGEHGAPAHNVGRAA
jgi:hypothetical protein